MRVCLAQVDPRPGDEAANVRLIGDALGEASRAGARLVVFPELATTGYRLGEGWRRVGLTPGQLAGAVTPPEGTAALVGFAERAPDGRLFSAAALVDGSGLRMVQRKLCPVPYPPFEESRWISRGEDLETFEVGGARAGVLICNDAWHPLLPYLLAQAGAGVLFVLANSAAVRGFDNPRRWSIVLRHTAALHGAWTVFVNRVGAEGGWRFWGGSRVLSPGAATVVRAGRAPALLYADLEPAPAPPTARGENGEVAARRRRP
jgi:N-carbamoylputrescine amidase